MLGLAGLLALGDLLLALGILEERLVEEVVGLRKKGQPHSKDEKAAMARTSTMSSTTDDLEISLDLNWAGALKLRPSLLPRWLYAEGSEQSATTLDEEIGYMTRTGNRERLDTSVDLSERGT